MQISPTWHFKSLVLTRVLTWLKWFLRAKNSVNQRVVYTKFILVHIIKKLLSTQLICAAVNQIKNLTNKSQNSNPITANTPSFFKNSSRCIMFVHLQVSNWIGHQLQNPSLNVGVMILVQRKKLVKTQQRNANVSPTTLVRNVKSAKEIIGINPPQPVSIITNVTIFCRLNELIWNSRVTTEFGP